MQPEATLNQLKASLPDGQLPPSYGVYFKNTLVALCHALEDHILLSSSQNSAQKPLVLVTFQQGKWYLQEADRYFDLAQCSAHVAIAAMPDSGFATHKTGQEDNVSLVHLDDSDSLVNEWNLIIVARDYAAMVLCHELSPEEYRADNQPTVDTERKFYGLWTFDRTLVEKSASILIERFRPYNPTLADRLHTSHQEISLMPSAAPADLSGVVARIVSYLQTSQQQLVTITRQTRELVELEGQALKMNRNLAANKLQAFLRMAQGVDERDKDNPVASLQVSALSETLGQIIDLPTLKLRRLRLAGLLFRIGLAQAPSEVFSQSSHQLNETNYSFWRKRAVLGAQLLATMPELAPIQQIVLHHLEHWDGSGTPNGLKGEEISIEARILGLVSYFQELTQPRGDRAAYNLTEALEQCQNYSGTRFDPALIESLTTVIRLAEMGLMQLPTRPSQLPSVWLEEGKKPESKDRSQETELTSS
ncbi:HD domain-containing phosphohydrolase [Gloeothece verrucosa]|uniref:Metal dependent phosphohydrolase n=1 Tax=Gloeothece verrucosa (strain PCC 7822) TaxID=497965 RepID=E0UE93_GLOV7|nr:HD domain-containing phosphohydrolase [Gloeothece verrucosa]ADN14218.1 metal dependent phosphohydrolase [Gloeothece verrucosa PCC 7822]